MTCYFSPPPMDYPKQFVQGGHRRCEAAFGRRSDLNTKYRTIYGPKLFELRLRFRRGDLSALDEAKALAENAARQWEQSTGQPNALTRIRERRLAANG